MSFSSEVEQRRTRAGALVAAMTIHLAAILALIAGFAPDAPRRVAGSVLAAIDLTPPPPTPPVHHRRAPAPRTPPGAAAPRVAPVAPPSPAPMVPLAVATTSAPAPAAPVAGTGTGEGSAGAGPGAGGAGGSGLAKIAGDINSAHDYAPEGRDRRIGDYVVIRLSIGKDGQPTACHIHRASRDPASDATTCRLAMERFRFHPATDAAGQPVDGTYGWQQRWHY